MDMRRFLPILLIAFAALFILPQLFKGGNSKTLSSKDRGLATRDAIEPAGSIRPPWFNQADGSKRSIAGSTRQLTVLLGASVCLLLIRSFVF